MTEEESFNPLSSIKKREIEWRPVRYYKELVSIHSLQLRREKLFGADYFPELLVVSIHSLQLRREK